MLRRPPRSTLFPTRRSSDLGGDARRGEGGGVHRGQAQGVEGPAGGRARDVLPAVLRGGERSEEHTSELQSQSNLVCRLLLEKKKKIQEQPCTAAAYATRKSL